MVVICFFFLELQLVIDFFFFFQAEDGIRDFHVTGVQTCALPISCGYVRGRRLSTACRTLYGAACGLLDISGRLLLGNRRSVSAVRNEVHRHWSWDSVIEYESAMGTRLGSAGIWRTGACERCRPLVDCGGVSVDDRRSSDPATISQRPAALTCASSPNTSAPQAS